MGRWRNFQLFLLSVSVFEHDLEGESAAELEVGVEAAPRLGTEMRERAFIQHRGLVARKRVRILPTLFLVWSPESPPSYPRVSASTYYGPSLVGAHRECTCARPEV